MISKTKNIIIRLFLLIVVGILFVPVSESRADYESFLSGLKNIDIPVDKMINKDGLSRYELTRLLNAVECKDCVNPSSDSVKKYNSDFWSNFKLVAGNNFNDISYVGGEWNGEKYYYCVAYVGDNDYMNGYPINTSPICAGKFCGGQTVNKAEFIQVIINLIGNYIYKDISTNRDNMKSWVDNLDKNSYQYKNFNEEDIKTIEDNAKKCNKKCPLGNGSEVQTYLKYCMFNLTECGMNPVGKLGQGYRPVAELNLLKNQKIIEFDQDYRSDIGGNMDVKKIFEVIYNLNLKVDCGFNTDYDCDSSENSVDTCPREYNPSQSDYDKDGIGDVCDDDIDNDGVKNPIGIVDDNGKINIRLWSQSTDNCLFVKNPDQKDSDKNGIGDACDDNQDYLSMYIFVNNFTGINAPLNVSFDAITEGAYKNISWKFSDGYTAEGKTVNHTFLKAGIYNVSADAKGTNNDAYADTTLIVGNNTNSINGIGIDSSKLGGKSPFETALSVDYVGKYDRISRNFGTNEIVENQDRSFKKLFTEEGTQTVIIKAIKDNVIKGVSQFNIGVGENYPGSILKANILNPEIGKTISLNTEFANFSTRDVSYIERNWGDGENIKTNSMVNNHTYNVAGQKVIIQKITLKNGKTMTNMITVFVVDKSKFKSNAIMILPSKLDNQIGGKVGFDIKVIGSKLESYINLIFKYIPSISEIIAGYRSKNHFDYTLINKGIYVPSAKININQCSYLKSDMTMYVNGNDFCLTEKLNGDLKKYKCDIDKDGIADICDDDIDGDGIKNLLGILNYENNDCSIPRADADSEDKDYLNQINFNILEKHFKGICSLDNAPFDKNSNQEDLNLDGIGDIVNIGISGNNGRITMFAGDSDGDGIPDYRDTCVEIQETYNGINDEDGCPEAGSDSACSDVSLCGDGMINQGETCKNCPIDVGICNNGTGNDINECGNGIIDQGETCDNCPSDVKRCYFSGDKFCGNGVIDDKEFCWNCPIDVGSCISRCGNGVVDQGETCNNCPSDVKSCGKCGNGIKDTNESCVSCPADYGKCSEIDKCGNGIIDQGETCNNCPSDVRRCYFSGDNCGNGIIDDNEYCWNCPIDVGSCISRCGNGVVDQGETCNNCPADIGICDNGPDLTGDNQTGNNGTGNNGTGIDISCGNGLIQTGETCDNCPADIGICNDGEGELDDISCGNGMIEAGETCISCPADVGTCEENIQVTPEECLQCPCSYSASEADIKNGNTVRATLRSFKKIIPYINSTPWIVDF